ncbi:MAG: type II secretion system F family protein, partial [Planctomycetes bacterium]|nr:type II secretion system F family protein [Planctomycetota bacterium]
FFFSQLSIMVETGVTLADAIHACLAQTPPGGFKTVLTEVLRNVESGESFSAALAKHPKAFGDFYVNLIRAAEASGGMAPMLRRCADYLTARREVRKRVKSALTYPLVLLVAAAGVTAFLMTFVLPKFLSIFSGKEAALPMPTVILMAVTDWLIAYWMFVLGGLTLGTALLMWFFRAGVTRPWADLVKLRVPLVGKILWKSYITSALRTLGVLVESGVSMLDAVAITGALSGNYHFERLWSDVAGRLHRGDQLSAPLVGSTLMPRPVVQMIEAGEKSGRLGAVLIRLCDYLDEELRTTIKTVTQLIEPIMIAVMGAVVGAIAIALLLPILTISKTIGH